MKDYIGSVEAGSQLPQGALAQGTLVLTEDGPKLVERLVPGVRVATRDNGPQPILHCEAIEIGYDDAADRPIEIKRGALGQNLPARRLVVPAAQKVMLLHDTQPLFLQAQTLNTLSGVRRMSGRRRSTFYALSFAQPQVIFAEGVALQAQMPARVEAFEHKRRHKTQLRRVG